MIVIFTTFYIHVEHKSIKLELPQTKHDKFWLKDYVMVHI